VNSGGNFFGKVNVLRAALRHTSDDLPYVLVSTFGGESSGRDGVVEDFVFGRGAVAEGGVSTAAPSRPRALRSARRSLAVTGTKEPMGSPWRSITNVSPAPIMVLA
jgi:hypothetical protein